jgi:hypothetical protein
MAVRFRSFGEAFRSFRLSIEGVRVNDKIRHLMGETAKRLIRGRVKRGFGLNAPGGSQERKLKPLKKSTIDRRRAKERAGLLATDTTPSTSNLTETGKMLGDIGYKLIDAGVKLSFKNERSRQVAEHVQDQGRPFFKLTNSEKKELRNIVVGQLKTLLKK